MKQCCVQSPANNSLKTVVLVLRERKIFIPKIKVISEAIIRRKMRNEPLED